MIKRSMDEGSALEREKERMIRERERERERESERERERRFKQEEHLARKTLRKERVIAEEREGGKMFVLTYETERERERLRERVGERASECESNAMCIM